MKPSRKGRRGKVTKLQSAKKLPPKLDQAQTFLTSFFSSSSEEPFVAQTPQTRLRQYVPLATPVVYTNDTNVQTPSRLIKPPSLGRLYPLVSSSPTKLYAQSAQTNSQEPRLDPNQSAPGSTPLSSLQSHDFGARTLESQRPSPIVPILRTNGSTSLEQPRPMNSSFFFPLRPIPSSSPTYSYARTADLDPLEQMLLLDHVVQPGSPVLSFSTDTERARVHSPLSLSTQRETNAGLSSRPSASPSGPVQQSQTPNTVRPLSPSGVPAPPEIEMTDNVGRDRVDDSEGYRLASNDSPSLDSAYLSEEKEHDNHSDDVMSDEDDSERGETERDEVRGDELVLDETDTHPEKAVETVAKVIYSLLTDRNVGCTEEEHAEQLRTHLVEHGENHHDLSATYTDTNGEGIRRRVEVGLYTNHLPLNKEYDRVAFVEATKLHAMFEGSQMHILREGSPKEKKHFETLSSVVRQVCLHKERPTVAASNDAFDIDSGIYMPSGLDAIKSFSLCVAQHMSLLLRSGLRVKKRLDYRRRDGTRVRMTIDFRDIPHLYLGEVGGKIKIHLFIFFPRLISRDKRFTHLPLATKNRFIDDVLLPAYRLHNEQHHIQHIASTSRVAELKALTKGIAYGDGTQKRGTKTYAQQGLPAESLEGIWEEMQRRVRDASLDLEDFEDAFLVANAKNLKTQFQQTGSLYKAITKYLDALKEAFVLERMDTMIHDVARESCGLNPVPNALHPDGRHQATTYQYRECCLDKQYESFRDQLFDGAKGKRTIYRPGFLRDAAGMTILTPTTSLAYKGGWIYGQWYPSAKEVGDANAIYPFDRPDLYLAAVDAGLYAGRIKREKRGNIGAKESEERAYESTKPRVCTYYTDTIKGSTGIRLEVRLYDPCLLRLQEEARIKEARMKNQVALEHEEHPSNVWAIATEVWANFILGNFDKFITAFETRRITCKRIGITKEDSKFMAVMIKCIQRFTSCDPSRDAILSWHTQDTVRGLRRGLGFQRTIKQHGYGWFSPDIIDWEGLSFKPEITTEVVTIYRGLNRWYNGAGRLLQDASAALAICLPYLKDPRGSSAARAEAGIVAAHICQREYRRDVIETLRKEFSNHDSADFVVDEVIFAYGELAQVLRQLPHCRSGNRNLCQQPRQLFEWLWLESSPDRYKRKHFEKKSFRLMMATVTAELTDHDLYSAWITMFQSEFWKHHWLIPYPDNNGTLISTIKTTGARAWWSTVRAEGGKGWAWGKEDTMPGKPRPYPSALTMDVIELARHLQAL